MKFYAALVLCLLVAGLSTARSQQYADDQYIIIYSLVQQADTLAGSGRSQDALTQYTDAQQELAKFQKAYPDWNPKIINFRLSYVAGKIAGLKAQLPEPKAPAQAVVAPVAAVPNAPPSGTAAPVVADDLRGQVQALQAANTTLQAKLKEALAAQPATADSRELAKAQEKISNLMKENDLLKVSLAQGKSHTNSVAPAAGTDALRQAQLALTDANQKLSEQIARADKLALDNRTLQGRLQTLLASPGALDALRAENELLKKQVADLKTAATNSTASTDRLNADLKSARLQIATLQSDVQIRQLEKLALENRLSQNPVVAKAPSADQLNNEARIRELTQERNDLLAKLGAANKELYGAKKQNTAAQIGDLNDQIKTLRARISVDEALAVPYTEEELALFRQPEPQLAGPGTEKKSIKELPEGSGQLVAEAQRFFAAKQYDKAEDNYQRILQRDENNPIALGNLAAIEMEQGKLDEAEKHLAAAVAQTPDDAYNLSMLGYLKFRQEKYDDALNILSRAAKLDPQNPEIQNYLGVTLSHKGLRVQAETALRKAVQIAPNYAAAHNNLAVIYINQTPPLVQLARWHYQKALAAGQPHNAELEKVLGGNFVPANAH
ncbi:MAG TPA: tetratricopeptide repeat protein [Verrucomicrobiae bacterium]|nr:tetratricopeptide repeat protein [Verrucomicrobiae bacterium]